MLHARPDGLLNMREPLQAGAEMYGLEGIEADIELIDLMREKYEDRRHGRSFGFH